MHGRVAADEKTQMGPLPFFFFNDHYILIC